MLIPIKKVRLVVAALLSVLSEVGRRCFCLFNTTIRTISEQFYVDKGSENQKDQIRFEAGRVERSDTGSLTFLR